MIALILLLAALPARAARPSASASGATLLFEKGRLSPAAAAYEAEAGVSASSEAYLNAGVIYRDLGEQAKAAEMLKAAAELAPEDPDVQAAYGWAAWRAGRYPAAEGAFRSAVKQDPKNAYAWLGWGRMLLARGQILPALELLQKGAEADPGSSIGWIYLARAQRSAGAAAKAAEAFEKALQVDPACVEARFELALLYQKMGDADDAWRQYALVLRSEPSNAAARRNKRMLSKLLKRPPMQLLPEVSVREAEAARPAPPEPGMPEIRVAIGTTASGRPELKRARAFRCTGPFLLSDLQTGRVLGEGGAGERYVVRPSAKGGFEVASLRGLAARFSKALAIEPKNRGRDGVILEKVEEDADRAPVLKLDRELKGRVELHVRGRRFYVVNQISLEDYVYGVVTGEMPARFPIEALKAQAVLARTHALFVSRHLPYHRRFHYDLCDGQHCQVYGGVTGESPQSRAAGDATRGEVLTYRGNLAQTPYSSNCGGHSQSSGDIPRWTDLPYLQGSLDNDEDRSPPVTPWRLDQWVRKRPAVYCNLDSSMPASRFRWERLIPAADLQARVNRVGRIGALQKILIVRRSEAGYANEVWFIGSEGRVRIDREQKIRGILGMGSVQSTLFVLEAERDARGRPVEFAFYGGGWGHGVGLCQYGAAGRAGRGEDFKTILKHYFPGTDLGSLGYGGGGK